MKAPTIHSFSAPLLLLVGLLILPNVAGAGNWRTGIHLKLFEYNDPRFARTGTLDELIYTGEGRTAYGYPYAINFKVKKKCAKSLYGGTFLNGGSVVAWVQSYSDGPFPEDLYATQKAVFPYGASLRDGSNGIDISCPNTRHPREGSVTVYARDSDYWWYDKGWGYHVVDVLDCSTQLGCQWYKGYAKKKALNYLSP